MNNNTHPIPELPRLTREFPQSIEFLLPLRSSTRHYDKDGGVVPVSNSSPETDVNENSSGEMYAMTMQVPICGHGTFLSPSENANGFMHVAEPVYAHTSASIMTKGIQMVNSVSLKWINKYGNTSMIPIKPPNQYLLRSSLVYQKRGPLSVYTNVAVIEAANHSADSNFWRSLYPPMELIDCHYGLAGLLYDNNVLSMGSKVGSDDSPNLENRRPSQFHRGFVDVCFTPQSKGAGRVRMLTFGVSIRIMTRRTIKLACTLLDKITSQLGNGYGDWVLRCMGFTTFITLEDVIQIVSVWKSMCEFNMPTVHVFEKEKVLVISIASGTLIRPIRTYVNGGAFVREGPFVDSMCIYHSDTMRFLKVCFPSPVSEGMQFAATSALIISFHRWGTEPRVNLGIQMTMQALNTSPIKGDATMVSMGERKPIIETDILNAITSAETKDCKITVPGTNIVTAFINRSLNTEDACSISQELAESGTFAWMGYIDYPLPKNVTVEVGMVLENESWWKPAMRGVIVNVFSNRNGSWNATVYIYSKNLMIGDKLATWHGLKFTVGEIIPYKEMPTLVDTCTNESFKPNMLISTKNLNRGLGSQIREMSASTSRFSSVNGFRRMEVPKGKLVFSQVDELKIEPTTATALLTMYGRKISFKDTNKIERTIKCNYGIMRVLQLRHLSSLKQHYPASPVSSITVRRGRYREGTPRLGEMELFSMLMQNLSQCVSEAVTSDGSSIVTVCSGCAALPLYCDCPTPKPETTKVVIRYSAVQLNTYLTTAMLNDVHEKPLTLRFLTST